MDNVLREIDNSDDYIVSDGFKFYNGTDGSTRIGSESTSRLSSGFNTGREDKTFTLKLADVEDDFNPLDTDEAEMSALEEEFNTCCDRCGEYIGWDKWEVNYYSSTRSPGLCERCTRLLDLEFGPQGQH